MSTDISTTGWITIIGWPVTVLLGIVGTIVAQKLARSKKRISWSVVSESRLLSEEVLQNLESGFGGPLQVFIGGERENELSAVAIKVANTGNTVLENINLLFKFGEETKLYRGRYVGDLGLFRKKLTLEKGEISASLGIAHINKGQAFTVEFLVGHYQMGSMEVDMSEPDVTLKKTDYLNSEIAKTVLQSLSDLVLGIRRDQVAIQTALLVDEFKSIKITLQQVAREQQRHYQNERMKPGTRK